VLASKIKVAFRRNVRNVCRYPALFAKLPYLCRRFRIVHGAKYHIHAIEIGGFEVAIDMCDLALGNAICDFFVQAVFWADYGDFGIGVEAFENSTRGNLLRVLAYKYQ
jgi:hypothetical protein